MLLILSITLPIIIFILGTTLVLIYKYLRTRNNVYEKGTILAKIDLNSRSIYTYDSKFNRTMPRGFHLNKGISKWISFDDVLDKYKGQETEIKIRSMLVDMEAGKSFAKTNFSLNTMLGKARPYEIIVVMYKLEDSSDIGMSMHWKLKTKEKNSRKLEIKPSTKGEIADLNFVYKGFMAFQLKSNMPNISEEFIYQLNKIISFKNNFYFLTNNILVIVKGDKKAARLKKRIVKLTQILENKGTSFGLNRMYNGTSYTIAKEVTSPKRINSVLELLYFNINLSLRTGKGFVNKETTEFNIDEYKVVSEASKIFKLAIKTKDIKPVNINVENRETNRKIMIYSFPEIKGISKEIKSIILRDPENVNMLMNTYAELVSIDKIIKEPALIDINNDWLMDNYEKMQYKRAIYVLNYNPIDYINNEKIIKELTDKKFTFAIRLKSFNEQSITILKKVKPQFVVIDKQLSDIQEPENYIQLLSIKKIADQEKIRIIYENPSNNVNSSMAEVLGIKYVYKLQ